ncbi:hypothetical protein G9A89_005643 [Geosiphon pyriformis]|nr:hypothetical protein G9A89_005643 [Geosiphon pyriformis]
MTTKSIPDVLLTKNKGDIAESVLKPGIMEQNFLIYPKIYTIPNLEFHSIQLSISLNLEHPSPFYEEISESQKQIVAKVKEIMIYGTMICGSDWKTVNRIFEYCKSVEQSTQGIYAILRKGSIHIADWACLRGFFHHNAIGTSRNYKLAFRFYRIAAAAGDAFAANQVGWIYDHSLGVCRNNKKAIEFYTKSALWGHPHGQMNLASKYNYGYFDLLKNNRKAFLLSLKAAELEFPNAMRTINQSYRFGTGVNKDVHEVFRWSVKEYRRIIQLYPFAETK